MRDFIGNYAEGSTYAQGGAIFNNSYTYRQSIIGNITGEFSDNHAKSETSYAQGGAIYNNDETIGDISGDFSGNYAQSSRSSTSGGAIYNENGTIGDINL